MATFRSYYLECHGTADDEMEVAEFLCFLTEVAAVLEVAHDLILVCFYPDGRRAWSTRLIERAIQDQ